MTSDVVWQLIRYALLAVFNILATKGYVSADQGQAIIGALGTIFTAGWGIYVKYGTKATTAAVAASPAVPTVSAATGQIQK